VGVSHASDRTSCYLTSCYLITAIEPPAIHRPAPLTFDRWLLNGRLPGSVAMFALVSLLCYETSFTLPRPRRNRVIIWYVPKLSFSAGHRFERTCKLAFVVGRKRHNNQVYHGDLLTLLAATVAVAVAAAVAVVVTVMAARSKSSNLGAPSPWIRCCTQVRRQRRPKRI
jgi:hypothetical protein